MNASTQLHMTDAGLFLIRAILAVVFVYHGSQKLFSWFGGYGIEGTPDYMASIGIPFPTFSTRIKGATESFGGIILSSAHAPDLRPLPWRSPCWWPSQRHTADSTSRRAAWGTRSRSA